MKTFRLTLLALAFSSFAGMSLAQPASDHNAHHPADAPTKSEARSDANAKPVDVAPLLGEMDAHMEAMRNFHQKFQNAGPVERRALMAEHHTLMQDGMKLMGAAKERTRGMVMMGMGGMMGQGMMGRGMMSGMDNPDANNQSPSPDAQMPSDIMQYHELMSKRMDMMQSMMQMMMDRMNAGNQESSE